MRLELTNPEQTWRPDDVATHRREECRSGWETYLFPYPISHPKWELVKGECGRHPVDYRLIAENNGIYWGADLKMKEVCTIIC